MINKTNRSPKVGTHSVVKASIIIAAVIFVGIPAFSYAATYAYVNSSGEVKSFTADTSAIAIEDAPDIGIQSGVLLMNSQTDRDMIDNQASADSLAPSYAKEYLQREGTYAYVDSSGEVRAFVADTSTIAIDDSPGIGTHSGVLLMNSQADRDMIGDQVSGM